MSKAANSADSAIGTVQTFKTKPITIQAIQFTGENGKDIVEFAKKNDFGAKNGGTYVHVFVDGNKLTVRKGDFIAVDVEEGRLGFFSAELFKKFHTISKTHAVL